LGATDRRSVGRQAYGRGTPVAFGTAKLGNDLNHAVMIGLRYNFNQPPH
jgi:hypothetical protein